MKIDNESIYHNALRLIRDEVIMLNGYDKEDMISISGFIMGVLDMAETMEEVLKA